VTDDSDFVRGLTMTTESRKKTGATTLSRMNFSGYVGDVTDLAEYFLQHAV